MKTAFINSMCHEIRTPLNAINGFSELLLTEQDPTARQAFQTEIGKSTKALTVLLENMLELSQLISTEDPLPVAQTDICLLCAERLELQRQLGDNPAVGYAYEAVEEGIEIPTNAFYLTRVLDNLLHNAAKFTAAGRITLRCRNDESRRTLQISVSDTGIGIPPEKQEWVFERFTKVDPFKPGSGIGLYLCRLIVTRLGGDIRVCPEYSGGCCIRIELPY
jgi:signal transduction histidine kinase